MQLPKIRVYHYDTRSILVKGIQSIKGGGDEKTVIQCVVDGKHRIYSFFDNEALSIEDRFDDTDLS